MQAKEVKLSPSTPDYKVTFYMALVHVMAIPALFTFSWENFWVCFVLYMLTGCIGVTLGFHRLLTHRSFSAPRWLERFLGFCGTLSMQGGPGEWVAHHRMHHSFTDKTYDPHNARLGFWHSHMGWLLKVIPEFDASENLKRYARDIYRDPFLRFLSDTKVGVYLQILLALTLWAIGGIEWVYWGVFLRLVIVYHVTWFVNSATHKYGYKNYEIDDLSKNCWWVGILAFGEGWHNNHHAFPSAARAGHKWWEFDLTFMIIRVLALFGIISDIKEPELTEQNQERVSPPSSAAIPEGLS